MPSIAYLSKLLSVFVLGAIELWAAIPAGFIMKLDPVTTAVTSALGAISGAFIVLTLGEAAKKFFEKFKKKKETESKESFIKKVWNKYGAPGLGLLAPLITGAPLGVILGVSLGADRKKLILWINIGVIIWSVILTLAVVLGIAGAEKIRH
ncbi:MAG: small multi-drug export protein [Armatimonadota bacterium]